MNVHLAILQAHALWQSEHGLAHAQWSQSGVFVRGELYPVVRLHFAKRQPPLGEAVPYIDSGPVAMEA